MKKATEKHPILSSIIFLLVSMGLVFLLLYPLSFVLPIYWYKTIKYGVSLIVTIAVMYLIYGKFSFSLKSPLFFKNLFTFGLLGFIGALGALFFSYQTIETLPSLSFFFAFLLSTLFIALSEEFLFRGLILGVLVRGMEDKGKRGIFYAVFIASTIFGIRHLLEFFDSPQMYIMVFTQVIFTFMAGVYLSALYLRTKNIWVCVTIHFLEDFFSSFWLLFASTNTVEDISLLNALLLIVLQVPYFIFGILFIKDKKWTYSQELFAL
ncbi:MAG: CPBP family intramembrane metalloprotease [Bacillales bacterium]|nr:CPBP family intramembrane metalloprotease [Bacillales bacterium]